MTAISTITVPLFSVNHKQIGGTESAIYNLVSGLAATEVQLTVAYADPAALSPDFTAWLSTKPINKIIRPSRLRLTNSRFFQEFMFEHSRKNSDWVIYPNYFIPPSRRKHSLPTATILYDIQYKILPHYHTTMRRIWLDFYLPILFKRADVVFLISHSELEFVRHHFGQAAADKCRVVPTAIDWERFDRGHIGAPILSLLDKPYILTVCHPFPHKNLSTLVSGFDRLAQEDSETWLYLVGKDSEQNRQIVKNFASEDTAKRINFTGFISDAELGALYRGARLFVLPSLYEGFGMPPVEALGLGVPTLVSRSTALPEATLGFAEYVDDLTAPAAWASSMRAILRSGARPTDETAALVRNTYRPELIGRRMLADLSSVR